MVKNATHTFDDFINHSEFKHLNEMYTCKRCKNDFKTRRSLNKHIETDHCDNIHFRKEFSCLSYKLLMFCYCSSSTVVNSEFLPDLSLV